MRAAAIGALPGSDHLPGGSVYEPKYDGYRALVFVQWGACRIQSRRGHDITHSFPEVVAAAIEHLPSGVVIDGELVVWDDGTADAAELARRLSGQVELEDTTDRPASFMAFDVLAGAGMDMRHSPFRVRRQALRILLGDAPAPLHVVPQTRDVDEARSWIGPGDHAHPGVDGVVAKGLASPYTPGERGWSALPVHHAVECVVGAVTGTLRAPARLILGSPSADGGLQVFGCTGDITLPQSRLLGSVLAGAAHDHPWRMSMPLRAVPGWHDSDEPDAQLVAPVAVVEVTAEPSSTEHPGGRSRTLLRTRPELVAADLDPL